MKFSRYTCPETSATVSLLANRFLHTWVISFCHRLAFVLIFNLKKTTIFRFFVIKPFRFLTLIINLHKL